jgi:hypothetical protein
MRGRYQLEAHLSFYLISWDFLYLSHCINNARMRIMYWFHSAVFFKFTFAESDLISGFMMIFWTLTLFLCRILYFSRFLHDFYTFIEHMLPAYIADLGYCLIGKRPRYVHYDSDQFHIHANFSKSPWGILRITIYWQNSKFATFSREIW